jgi:ubiquinone/menaquinone biosynthesis C-methylase UbiE
LNHTSSINPKFPIYFRLVQLFQAMSIKPTSSYSSNYERMSGNCTRIIASQMVASINPPITNSSYILDNACGPGIVSEQIKLLHPEANIMATDLSPAMIEEVKDLIKTENWSNMATDTLDVRDRSNIKDNTFSHVFTNLGLPVPGDQDSGAKVTKEIYRVLQRNGVAMVSTWAGEKSSWDFQTSMLT